MSARKAQKEAARARRLQQEAELRARTARRRRRVSLVAMSAALVVVGGVVVATQREVSRTSETLSIPRGALVPLASLGRLTNPRVAGPLGPEGVPIPHARSVAGAEADSGGSPVDGIQCQGAEQVLFHIHAHLTVFANGAPRGIPAGIGIPGARVSSTPEGPYVAAGSCFYWLHTHAADGIIHIESPVQRTYTLGNFFDVWGQRLGPNDIGPLKGPVTALYNGQVFRGNPRDIPLTKHAQIQLELGRPLVAPVRMSFPAGL